MNWLTLPSFRNAAIQGLVAIAAMISLEPISAIQPLAQPVSSAPRTTSDLIAPAPGRSSIAVPDAVETSPHNQVFNQPLVAQAANGEISVEYQPAQDSLYQAVSSVIQRSQAFEGHRSTPQLVTAH